MNYLALLLLMQLQAWTWRDTAFTSSTPQSSIYDHFTDAQASPITTPRSATPGPGTWTVTQTDGTFVINNLTNANENFSAGTGLRFTAQSSAAWGDLRIIRSSSLTRQAGLACLVKWDLTSGNEMRMGFERATITGAIDGAAMAATYLTLRPYVGAIGPSAWASFVKNTEYETAIILRPSGAYCLVRQSDVYGYLFANGGFPDWTLLWVSNDFTDATCSPAFDAYDGNGDCFGFRVSQLDSSWTNAYRLASSVKATSVNDDTSTMPANAIVEHTITGATGVTQELRVREQNSTNRWIVRMSQSGSTIKLIEVVNGTETERATAAFTWNNGTQYRVSVVCYYKTLAMFVDNTKYGSTYTTAATGLTATGVSVSHAGANLIAWDMLPQLPQYFSPHSVIIGSYGDSKTDGSQDTGLPTGTYGGFQRYLVDGLNTNGMVQFVSVKVPHGGYTVSNLQTVVDSDLANFPGTPTYVLVNMGANDCGTTIDSTFSNNYAYILDALHAKWPLAKVYVMGLWHRSCTQLANIRAAASTLIAARSGWCFAGPDEAVFLENGDDGATYTADGIHPNHAGYLLTAQKWRQAIGL